MVCAGSCFSAPTVTNTQSACPCSGSHLSCTVGAATARSAADEVYVPPRSTLDAGEATKPGNSMLGSFFGLLRTGGRVGGVNKAVVPQPRLSTMGLSCMIGCTEGKFPGCLPRVSLTSLRRASILGITFDAVLRKTSVGFSMAGSAALAGRTGAGAKDKASILAADDAKRLVVLEGKIAEQKKELENRDITIRAIQRNFEQLSSLCQADKEQIAQLQKKLAEANQNVVSDVEREYASKYPKLKDAFDSLNNMYVDSDSKISKLQQELAAALASSNQAKQFQTQLQEGKKALEEARQKLAEAERAASVSESKLRALEEHSMKKVKEMNEAIKAGQKRTSDLEKSEATARSDLSRVQAQMMKVEQSALKEVQELKRKLAESESARTKDSSSSAKAAAAVEEAKKASAAYQKQLQEMHSMLEKATSQVGGLQARVKELEAKDSSSSAKAAAAAEEAKKASEAHQKQLQEMRSKLEGATSEVGGLQAQVKELEAKLVSVRDECALKDQELRDALGKVTGLAHSTKALEEKVDHLHAQNEFWEGEDAKAKEKLRALERERDVWESKEQEWRQKTEELGAASSEASALSTALDALKHTHARQLSDAEAKAAAAQRAGDAAEKRERDADRARQAAEGKLEEAEAELQALRSGAKGQAELAAEIASLKDKLEKREANLARSENIIKKLMAEVQELKQ